MLDRELACSPLNSKVGQDYLSAMKCAMNRSFAKRQVNSPSRMNTDILSADAKPYE